jgi:hypothetical protein
MNCVDVCPKGLNPTKAIGKIKELMVKRRFPLRRLSPCGPIEAGSAPGTRPCFSIFLPDTPAWTPPCSTNAP